MSTTAITPELKHPYLDGLKSDLETYKRKLELLENKKYILVQIISTQSERILKSNYGTATMNDQLSVGDHLKHVNNQLDLIETAGQIKALTMLVKTREQYIIKYTQQFVIDLADVEKFYETVIAKAKAMATSNKALKDRRARVNWEGVEAHIDAKIRLFKDLLPMIK